MNSCFSGVCRVSCFLLLFAITFLTACSDQDPTETTVPDEMDSQAPDKNMEPVETAAPDEDGASPVIISPPEPEARVESEAVLELKPVVTEVTTASADSVRRPAFEKQVMVAKKSAGAKVKGPSVASLTYNNVTSKSKQVVASVASKTVDMEVTDSAMIVVAPDLASGDLSTLDVYKVKLAADMQLTVPGSPGELIVWIGAPEVEKRFKIGMVTDETHVPAIGETARVRPHAPDFDIKPEVSQCIKIHRSGSEVRFELMPKEAGSFKVGADVLLFETGDCSGPPVPKVVENLMVEVVVNEGKLVEQGLGKLMTIAWEKFLEFWGALVALVLALLLFAVRGKFKQWFGFK